MSIDTSLFGAMEAARQAAANQQKAATVQEEVGNRRGGMDVIASDAGPGPYSGPPAGGGGGGGEDPAVTAARIAAEANAALYEAQRQERIAATIGVVKAAFSQYGLASLYPMVEKYARMGMTEDEIYMNLRTTPEYKARFPAMETLAGRGQAISEASYIDFERKSAQLEQMFGFPQGMVSGAVTDLLIGDVSLVELQDRLTLASADSITAPPDLRQQLEDFYGIDPDEALRAYYLDPERALPILQKQSATARIGVQATRAGLSGVGVGLAEELQGLGLSETQAGEGFQRTAQMQNLSYGRGDVATTSQLIGANLKGSAADAAVVQRAAKAKAGRFQEGGGYAVTQQGVSGLGSAATR
jgi:hypothetical protein